jgi:CubicO group peptidase (beta-lactamase class C family)
VIRPGDPARRKAMKRLHILLILFILSGMTVWLAAGGPPSTPAARDAGDFPAAQAQKIRAFADTTLKTWEVPGAAVGIVKDGRVVFLEGFGKRDLEKGLPVTSQTRFILGSTTKAFTALSVGLLAAEKKLDWDKPVSDYLPEFRLMDEYASLHATPRDLASHRSGLPRHDLVWVNSSQDLPGLVRSLRFLEPSRELRAAFQYNNLMYVTLGYLVERISGRPWDAFVQERIFQPLGMTDSGCTIPEYTSAVEYAFSYKKEKEGFIARPFPRPEEKLMYGARASGSINTTAADMARWVTEHLAPYAADGKTVFPADLLREMHTPQIPVPQTPRAKDVILSPSYGLGWMTDIYRKEWRVQHGGSTLGFNSFVAFFPHAGIGLVVLINAESPAINILANGIADLALGLEPIDWSQRFEKMLKAGDQSEPKEPRAEGTRPAHKLEKYAAEYIHPAYGTLKVEIKDGRLLVETHGFSSPLEHWHFETFRVAESELRGQKITFRTDESGRIVAAEAKLEPAVKDIVFERIPQPKQP